MGICLLDAANCPGLALHGVVPGNQKSMMLQLYCLVACILAGRWLMAPLQSCLLASFFVPSSRQAARQPKPSGRDAALLAHQIHLPLTLGVPPGTAAGSRLCWCVPAVPAVPMEALYTKKGYAMP